MAEQPPPAITVPDLAELLAVDDMTIYRQDQQEKLPTYKMAGPWRLKLQDIRGLIDEQKRKLRASFTGCEIFLKDLNQ